MQWVVSCWHGLLARIRVAPVVHRSFYKLRPAFDKSVLHGLFNSEEEELACANQLHLRFEKQDLLDSSCVHNCAHSTGYRLWYMLFSIFFILTILSQLRAFDNIVVSSFILFGCFVGLVASLTRIDRPLLRALTQTFEWPYLVVVFFTFVILNAFTHQQVDDQGWERNESWSEALISAFIRNVSFLVPMFTLSSLDAIPFYPMMVKLVTLVVALSVIAFVLVQDVINYIKYGAMPLASTDSNHLVSSMCIGNWMCTTLQSMRNLFAGQVCFFLLRHIWISISSIRRNNWNSMTILNIPLVIHQHFERNDYREQDGAVEVAELPPVDTTITLLSPLDATGVVVVATNPEAEGAVPLTPPNLCRTASIGMAIRLDAHTSRRQTVRLVSSTIPALEIPPESGSVAPSGSGGVVSAPLPMGQGLMARYARRMSTDNFATLTSTLSANKQSPPPPSIASDGSKPFIVHVKPCANASDRVAGGGEDAAQPPPVQRPGRHASHDFLGSVHRIDHRNRDEMQRNGTKVTEFAFEVGGYPGVLQKQSLVKQDVIPWVFPVEFQPVNPFRDLRRWVWHHRTQLHTWGPRVFIANTMVSSVIALLCTQYEAATEHPLVFLYLSASFVVTTMACILLGSTVSDGGIMCYLMFKFELWLTFYQICYVFITQLMLPTTWYQGVILGIWVQINVQIIFFDAAIWYSNFCKRVIIFMAILLGLVILSLDVLTRNNADLVETQSCFFTCTNLHVSSTFTLLQSLIFAGKYLYKLVLNNPQGALVLSVPVQYLGEGAPAVGCRAQTPTT